MSRAINWMPIWKAGIEVLTKLKIPTAAGNPAGVQDQWLWIDTAAGKLAFRLSGSTILVPLPSDIPATVGQEQVEDWVSALIQDNADIDWTYTDNGAGAGALVGVIKNDSMTYAKIQNVSTTARVLGRITAGAGDIEELTGANIRTILGTLDADTLGGQSASALTTSITAAIVNSAPGTLDTLKELADAIGDDPNFATTLTNLVNARARYFAGAVPNGAATANIDHNFNLTNIHDFMQRVVVSATGVEEEYEAVGSTANRIVLTDETGANIAAGRRIFVVAGV